MLKWINHHKIHQIPNQHLGSLLIAAGILIVLCCLMLMAQPLYTMAQEDGDNPCRFTVSPDVLFEERNLNPGDTVSRTLTVTKLGTEPAYLWVRQEWLDGNPLSGEQGDLYNQIILIITWRGIELYYGLLSGLEEPLNISSIIGPLRPGQVMNLDFTVYLPGPQTGNEFQGSTLNTRFIFYTRCGTETEVPPEPPGTNPPELPPTSGIIHLLLIFCGFVMIILGIMIKRKFARDGANYGSISDC